MLYLPVISVLLLLIAHCSSQLNCALDSPKVFVHYYQALTTINITQERQVFSNLSASSCTDPVDDINCCTCSDNRYAFCSSLIDVVNLQQTENAKSIFIGLFGTYLSIGESVSFDFNGNLAFASINEYDTAVVNCIKDGISSLVFVNLNNVYMGNVILNDCGRKNQHDVGLSGVVRFENCYHTVIENVSFDKSIGSAIVYNITDIDGTDTTPKKKKPSKELVELAINNCNFTSSNIISNNASVTMYGGGVAIYIHNPYLPVILAITDSIFYNNQATYGGSIALITNSDNLDKTTVTLQVMNTTFIENLSSKDGGAYYQLGLVDSTFTDCMFRNNTALHFGGVATILGLNANLNTNNDYSITQSFEKSEFSHNKATSYAIMYVSLPATIDNEKFKLKSITANSNRLSPEVFDNDNCMIYFNNVNVYISNDTTFMDNYGSAICLDGANLHVKDKVEFFHNFGYRGGALNMKGESTVYPNDGSSMLFVENNAVYGGAIYKGSVRNYDTENNASCLFDFQDFESNYTITFTNNLARLTGAEVYIVDLANNNHCIQQLEENSNVIFSSLSKLNIETAAIKINFSDPVHTDHNNNYILNVSLGIYLTLNTSIQSETSFDSSALFYITLLKDSHTYYNDVNRTKLNGPAALSLSQGATLTNLYFTGNEINSSNKADNFSLSFNLADDYSVATVINLNFIPCKLGFRYDQNEEKCVCVKSPHLLCNERQNLACIERGFWYGTENGVVIPCYSGFCQNSFGSCLACELEGGGTEYCRLQDSENNECIENHNGLGCIYCDDNSTFTLGAQRCINKEKCNMGRDISVIVICCFLYLILIIGMLYLVQKIDNQKNFGYLYCIVYYYSVISFVLPASLVNSKISAADFIIQSIITQNPLFLGQLDLCVELISSPIYLIALNYTFPLVIIMLLWLLILLSRSFPRYIKFNGNAGVRGTCIVILFSFTAFLETSFNIINPVRYSVSEVAGKTNTYVSSDPLLEYLDTNYPFYIVLWVVGILFMIVFIIPLTFFLLFSPLIMRYFNLNKIKPFLDQFYACYKDEYRWMCGFYFLNRLIYFAIIIDPTTTEVSSYPYIRYLSVAVVIIHCLLQPYKSKSLNIADAVILSNIALLSLIHNVTEVSFFGVSTETVGTLRLTATYILLYIPGTYLLILLIIFSFQKSSKLRKAGLAIKLKSEHVFYNCREKMKHSDKNRLIESHSNEESFNLNFEFSAKQTNDTRESLLSFLQENEVINEETKPLPPTQTKKPPLPLPIKPKFSELLGSGAMSPGERQGSFLVQYVHYRQDSEDSTKRHSEMVEVTGN